MRLSARQMRRRLQAAAPLAEHPVQLALVAHLRSVRGLALRRVEGLQHGTAAGRRGILALRQGAPAVALGLLLVGVPAVREVVLLGQAAQQQRGHKVVLSRAMLIWMTMGTTMILAMMATTMWTTMISVTTTTTTMGETFESFCFKNEKCL